MEDIKDTPIEPSKKSAKNRALFVRIGDDETGMLDYIAEQTGKSVSDIVRDSLKMAYNLEKSKN